MLHSAQPLPVSQASKKARAVSVMDSVMADMASRPFCFSCSGTFVGHLARARLSSGYSFPVAPGWRVPQPDYRTAAGYLGIDCEIASVFTQHAQGNTGK